MNLEPIEDDRPEERLSKMYIEETLQGLTLLIEAVKADKIQAVRGLRLIEERVRTSRNFLAELGSVEPKRKKRDLYGDHPGYDAPVDPPMGGMFNTLFADFAAALEGIGGPREEPVERRIETLSRAMRTARDAGDDALAQKMHTRIELLLEGKDVKEEDTVLEFEEGPVLLEQNVNIVPAVPDPLSPNHILNME